MPTDNPTNQPDDGGAAESLPNRGKFICVINKQSSPEDIYETLSLDQVEQDGKPSFAFHRSSHATSSSEENKALRHLEDLKINGPPSHLQPGPRRHIHVLVSTHSGTGLSLQFYNGVLAPLLEAVGLTASEGPEHERAEQQGSYHLLITQDAGSVKRFAQNLAGWARDEKDVEHTVVLLSGDGGIVDMLNGYASSMENDEIKSNNGAEPQNLPLVVILPLGTGNALFSSLHRTVKKPAASDLVQGLRTLLHGKAAPLPSFKATFPDGSRTITYSETSDSTSTGSRIAGAPVPASSLEEQTGYVTHLYGVVVASYGFHSQLVWESDTPAYRQHGAKRFQMVAQELLKESHAYRATVEITRSTTEGEAAAPEKLDRDRHAYVLATPVSNLEKTFCISPASQPLDGQLRLVHFGPVDGATTMEIMMAAYDGGKHVNMRWDGTTAQGQIQGGDEGKVGYEDISEVRVTTHEEKPRWRKVCIDGTIVEIPTGGCMVISKEARQQLSVLVDRSVA